jgi:hypothetical protein
MLVTGVQALQEVRKNFGVGRLKNTSNKFRDLGGCNPIIILSITYGPGNGLGENNRSSSELPKHPVDNIGMRNRPSSEDNDEATGENLEEKMEVPHGVGDLVNEGGWRFGGRVKPPIERRGEDDEYTQVQNVKKASRRGHVWYVSPCAKLIHES